MVLKSICKWWLEYSQRKERNCPFISNGSDISSLKEVLTARMRAKKCTFHVFHEHSDLVWPTVELDTLMALMCTYFLGTRLDVRKEDPGVMQNFSSIPWKERKTTRFQGMGVKASGHLSPCQIC